MANLTSSLTVKLIDDVSKPARTVAQALQRAEKEAKDLAKAMSGSGATNRFVADLSKLKLSAKDVEKVADAWKDYSRSAKLAADSTKWTKAQSAAVRDWERNTIRALRDVRKEQVSFNHSIAAASARAGAGAVSPMMMLMSQSTTANKRMIEGMGKHGKRGGAGSVAAAEIGAAELAAAGGILGRVGLGHVASGYAAYHVGRHAFVSGASYQHVTTALQNLGLTLEEMKHVTDTAQQVTRAAPGTSATEALEQIRETIGAFGSLEHAVEHASTLAQINSVLQAAGRDKVTSSAENAQNFVRYFEERGVAGDAERFKHEAKEQARAMAFFGEKYNAGEMLNFAQQAKAALIPYNERFATKIAPSLVTMLGGPRAGTAANMWNKTIMGRVNDKLQAQEWMRLGLLDPKQVIMKQGHVVAWKPGAIKGTDLAMRDPLAWTETMLLPALEKVSINTNDLLQMQKENALLFRNSSANVFASELSLPASRQRLHKDEALQNRVGTFDQMFQRNQAQDPTVAWENLKKSMENLGSAATSALPVATVLNVMAKDFNNVAQGMTAGGLSGGASAWWESVKEKWGRLNDKGNGVMPAGTQGAGRSSASFESSLGLNRGPTPAPMFTQIEAASPHVDLSQVDAAKANVVAASGEMQQALSFSAAPNVDSGPAIAALNAIIARAEAARAAIGGVTAAAGNAMSAVSAAKSAASSLPSFAAGNRASFSAAGDPAGK